MDVLLVSWDGGGCVPPLLGLGAELVRRGHAVRCLGPRAMQPGVERAGIVFVPTQHAPDRSAAARIPSAQGWPLIQEVWFGPSYGLDLRDEIGHRRPDVAVIDASLVGAQNAANEMGLQAAILVHMVGTLEHRGLQDALPRVNASRERRGLDLLESVEALIAATGVRIVSGTPLLDEDPLPASPHWRYAGPIFEPALPGDPLAARAIAEDARPAVLVGLSTTYMERQEELLSRVIEALRGLPVRGLVGAGPGVDMSALPVADNVMVAPWLSHDQVLPNVDLMITHAGHSSVARAMSHGVPQLCLPLGRDQPFNARRVAALGLGLHLPMESAPADIAQAVVRMLGDTSYRAKSRAAGASIAAMGHPASNAADIVESLAR